MKERPILFNSQMVRSILDGRKTQTRRVIKPQPSGFANELTSAQVNDAWQSGFVDVACPLGKPGDRLWVREAFRLFDNSIECGCSESPCGCPKTGTPIYRATHDDGESKWTPSIHMPRWASRITLEITGVRVERLQDISEDDAQKEGVSVSDWAKDEPFATPRDFFRELWDSVYGEPSWNANPWVWVIEFKRLEQQQ